MNLKHLTVEDLMPVHYGNVSKLQKWNTRAPAWARQAQIGFGTGLAFPDSSCGC